MMPIVFSDPNSLPDSISQYAELINQCGFKHGDICYLTITESFVPRSHSQRRGGIHVEAPYLKSWGGGSWGGMSPDKGIYMASNDGNTNVWDEIVNDRDEHGACSPNSNPIKMQPSNNAQGTPHRGRWGGECAAAPNAAMKTFLIDILNFCVIFKLLINRCFTC